MIRFHMCVRMPPHFGQEVGQGKRDAARGGVYHEADFAHGLGIPVVFIRRRSRKLKPHFDTRQYNRIFWNDPEQLRKDMMNRICATVGEGSGRTVS